MPSKNRFGLDDDQCFFPTFPGSRQLKPEDSILLPEFRPPVPTIQNGKLLAEGKVFECQFRTKHQGCRNQRKQSQNREHHSREFSGPSTRKVNRYNTAGVLARHNHLNPETTLSDRNPSLNGATNLPFQKSRTHIFLTTDSTHNWAKPDVIGCRHSRQSTRKD